MENKLQLTKEQQMLLEKKQQRELALYSPINCAKHSHKIRTVQDAIKLPSKSLAEFRREYGREWLIGYVSMWIIELNDNSNVKTKMTDAQMEFTAERIIDTYSLRVTDLTLFFRNVKEGIYGLFYENLSTEKILEWLSKYFNERCEVAEMMSQSNHEGFMMIKDGVHPDVAKKMFDGVGDEKVEHDHEKNTLGRRTKKVITKDLNKEISLKSDEELKEYLIKYDATNPNYNDFIYTEVEQELDRRNKTK